MTDSIWLEHPEFPGYRFSPEGRALSLIGKRPLIMKPSVSSNGYVLMSFQKNGKKTRQLLHRLVGQVFVPGYEERLQINHKNGIKTDNRAENLEWVTPKQNIAHLRDVLGRKWDSGENHGSSTISDAQALRAIRLRYKERKSYGEIEEITGITKGVLTGLLRGRRWARVFEQSGYVRPTRRFSSKLSHETVLKIRKEADPKKRNYGSVANKYNTSKPMVCLIYNRKIYGDIE
jgi:hypothetical protein